MMKKIVRILAMMLALVLCLSVVGCGKKATDAELTTIEEGVLTMGTNASFKPYEFTDDNGNIVGIDAEIAKAVADKLGLELKITDMKFESLLLAVQNNTVDVVFAGLTVTEERKEAVNFTDSYATGIQVVIVKEDSAIASIDDLAGKTIGVQTGTTGDLYCTDNFGQEFVSQFDDGTLAVDALKKGTVDCVVIDNEPAKSLVAVNSGLKILETEYTLENYAAAVSKNNTVLQQKINEALTELKADGTIDKIIAKYIPAE